MNCDFDMVHNTEMYLECCLVPNLVIVYKYILIKLTLRGSKVCKCTSSRANTPYLSLKFHFLKLSKIFTYLFLQMLLGGDVCCTTSDYVSTCCCGRCFTLFLVEWEGPIVLVGLKPMATVITGNGLSEHVQ